MDNLRGHFSAGAEPADDRYYDSGDDDMGAEAPPSPVGQDERRMQVRAYNHWASLLQDRNFPSISDLDPENLPDFGPYSVLLDFSGGIEDPQVNYIGAELARECDSEGGDIDTLSDVPARSLLTRITDHYMQILANQAPIGFEAEFINQRGTTILYRGILLPFSSDDDTIDFIYGVINWKELADQKTTDELMLEIDQVLEDDSDDETEEDILPVAPDASDDMPVHWADGPAASGDAEGEYDNYGEEAAEEETASPAYDQSVFGLSRLISSSGIANVGYDDDDEDDDLPAPSFGWRETPIVGDNAHSDTDAGDMGAESDEEAEAPATMPDGYSPLVSKGQLPQAANPFNVEVADEDGGFDEDESYDDDTAYGDVPSYDSAPVSDAGVTADEEPLELDTVYEEPVAAESAVESETTIDIPDLAESDMGLGDWLASAREFAEEASRSEERTRQALYCAIGRAYDFSIAAMDAPEEFEEIVADAGLTMQERAPMTPVVKLVFGADYDKTRLTEYAAALSHGHRMGIARGELAEFIEAHDGGLKGVIQAERRLRREEAGKPVEIKDRPREGIARKLREIEATDFAKLDRKGPEFALVMIRRNEAGEIEMIGEVPEDVPLVERAARKLLG